METLEKSNVCRLCGKKCQISVDIFDKNENHVRKINAILPILVHEIDFLPKQMCHRCSYKLEEFYNFYVECAKTDSDLKSQLSWMSKETSKEQIITPMVKMNPFKIKTEPPDCKDSDSSDVFDHVSSFGSFATPILTCSRCRCLCSTTVKESKSPVAVKTFLKSSADQKQYNDASNNFSNKNGESKKSENTNVDFQIKDLNNDTFSKELLNAKEECKNKIPVVVIDNSDCNFSQDLNDLKNRALRPRKDSIDYVGPKKSKNKLREKFKNKEDIFDSEIVDPVNVLVTSNTSLHPSPIIKLKKVDDTLKSIRARKNLEEFNKRVKELEHTRRLHREKDLSDKILKRLKDRSRKNFQKEDCQTKNDLCKDKNLKRKSVHLDSKNEESSIDESRNNLQEVNQDKNRLVTEKNQNSKISPKKIKQNKIFQNGNNHYDKILEVNTVNNQPCLITDATQISTNNKTQNFVIKIEGEVVNKVKENSNTVGDQSLNIDLTENEKRQKVTDRNPMFPVVKLEKDYTCNVDYPRVKIKRHLAVVDPEKSVNGALDVSVEGKSVLQDKTIKKSLKIEQNPGLKSVKKKEKKSKNRKGTDKEGKISKKKHKQVNLCSVKKVVSKQGSLNEITQSELKLKHFCEECDKCFKNRELFKLHPCYQK